MSADERGELVESAVSVIAESAPEDWVSLHAEFVPMKATATATTERAAEPVTVEVSPEALENIAIHQRRSAEAGEPWHRLVVDCDRAGTISVSTETTQKSRLGPVLLILAALLVVVAVGALFVLGV